MGDAATGIDLKGGHAPANKVGGVRLVSKAKNTEEKPLEKAKLEKEEPEDLLLKEGESDHKRKVEVSGATITEEEAFPKEALKVFHEKPQPTHVKGANNKPKIIQQPKK